MYPHKSSCDLPEEIKPVEGGRNGRRRRKRQMEDFFSSSAVRFLFLALLRSTRAWDKVFHLHFSLMWKRVSWLFWCCWSAGVSTTTMESEEFTHSVCAAKKRAEWRKRGSKLLPFLPLINWYILLHPHAAHCWKISLGTRTLLTPLASCNIFFSCAYCKLLSMFRQFCSFLFCALGPRCMCTKPSWVWWTQTWYR